MEENGLSNRQAHSPLALRLSRVALCKCELSSEGGGEQSSPSPTEGCAGDPPKAGGERRSPTTFGVETHFCQREQSEAVKCKPPSIRWR